MVIQVDWYNEAKTALRCRCGPGWAWSDLADALPVGVALMGEVWHRVDVVLDLRDDPQLPEALPQSVESLPDNHGTLIVLGVSGVLETALIHLRQMFGPKLDIQFVRANSEIDMLISQERLARA